MITRERAFVIASNWGSYMHSGDPGSVFYGFHFNDGRPIDEHHRRACLDYAATLKPSTKPGKREIAELVAFLAVAELYLAAA